MKAKYLNNNAKTKRTNKSKTGLRVNDFVWSINEYVNKSSCSNNLVIVLAIQIKKIKILINIISVISKYVNIDVLMTCIIFH